ncbi:MAG: hypothetical protein ACTSWN_11610 [Promethearchaeota archaeon]
MHLPPTCPLLPMSPRDLVLGIVSPAFKKSLNEWEVRMKTGI